MGALSRLIAKELSSAFGLTKKVEDIKTEPALGIVDNPKYNPAFKERVEKLSDEDVDIDVEGLDDAFDDYSSIDDDVLDDIDLFDDVIDDGFRVDADGNRILLDTDGNTMVDANGNPMLERLDYDSEGNIIDLDAIDASVENEMFFLDNATEDEYTRHFEFIQNSTSEEIDDYYAQYRQRFMDAGDFDDPQNIGNFNEVDDQARLFEDNNTVDDPRQYIDQDAPENTIATFYSPLMSALDEAPISDKGTMGKNIMAFIRKRSPKMSEGELNYTGDFLEPNKKYTRQEAKDLAYEKGLTVNAVINQGRKYQDWQRQRLSYKDYMEIEEDYVEILLEGQKNTYRGKDIRVRGSHHNSNTIAHARLSLHVDLEEFNDAILNSRSQTKSKRVQSIYKQRSDFADSNLENAFLLIGELQSDMLQKVGQSGQSPTKDRLPINKDKDYLRNLLQSIFIYAKNNNINTIVLPPVKKLREKRLDDLRISSKDEGQKMFDVTYNKAFRKALKSLQDEYPKGTIKTREKKLKFMDAPNKDTISDKEFFMQNASEKQKRDHNRMHPYDDERTQRGYARYKDNFYNNKFENYTFKDEDISTETALEIDISDLLIGNTVPRLNKGGLIKKPGLMQRPS